MAVNIELPKKKGVEEHKGFRKEVGSDTLMLIRYGAFGDHIFMSAIFPFLFQKYNRVLLETNTKGIELFRNDSRFTYVGHYEPFQIPEDKRLEIVAEHWEKILERYPEYDFLNLWGAMEGTAIVHENHPDAALPQEQRREKYHLNFHEQYFKMAGLSMPDGWMADDQLVFSDEWEEWARDWRERDKDYFVMVVCIAGSTMQKVFPTWLPSYCRYLIDKYKDLKIYLFGDHECDGEDWEYERTKSWVHRKGRQEMSFSQSLLMTKYADYVFGPETGLLAGAGMWGVPKTYLCTAADKEQLTKYHRNDFSVQSRAPCSPCYRTCYYGKFCRKEMYYNLFPECTVMWDWDELLAIFEEVYGRGKSYSPDN